jgi:hypothetical protein
MAEEERGDTDDETGRRSPGERADATMRTANRTLREVADPNQRAKFLLTQANVLALLDLADAIRGSSLNGKG